MSTLRRLFPRLLILFLALPGVALAAKGRLVGKVVDPEGQPIAGVSVVATSAEDPDFHELATSNEKGIFKVDLPRLGVLYRYEFQKAGYITLKMEQSWTFEGTERHEFELTPLEATAGGAPPPSTSNAAILAFNNGVTAFKAKGYEEARVRFEEALSFDPYMGLAWAALAQVHLELKQHQEAATAADKAVALGVRNESVLRVRWEAYRNLGDDARAAHAREDLEKHGRLSDEAKRIHNEGVALLQSGDDASAFAKFQAAVALDPGLESAQLGVAATGLEIGRATEAYTAAEAVLATSPANAEALKLRYNAALELGEEAKLAVALSGLAAVNPTTACNGLFALGTSAFQRDDAGTAKERFGQALAIDPGHAQSHYYLGLIFMREGAAQEAKDHLRRFLELAPDDPDAAMAKEALALLK